MQGLGKSGTRVLVVTLAIISTLPGAMVLLRGETNLIGNGDFSNELADWTARTVVPVGQYPIIEVVDENPPPVSCTPGGRRGNPFLSINVPFGATGYVEQEVDIPASGALLSFVVWGWEDSNPQLGFNGLVNASVRVVEAGQESILETFVPPPMFVPGGGFTEDVCRRNLPILKSYDLSQLSGQTVKLRLRAESQNCCGTLALFDDVRVEPLGDLPQTLLGILWLVPGLLAFPLAVLFFLPQSTIGVRKFFAFIARSDTFPLDYSPRVIDLYKSVVFIPNVSGAIVFLSRVSAGLGLLENTVLQFLILHISLLFLSAVGLVFLATAGSRALYLFLGDTFSNLAFVSGSLLLFNLLYVLLDSIGVVLFVAASIAIFVFLGSVMYSVTRKSVGKYLGEAETWEGKN